MSATIEKLEEYSQKGVPNIWLIDPRLAKMFVYRSSILREVPGSIATDDARLELTRSEVFEY